MSHFKKIIILGLLISLCFVSGCINQDLKEQREKDTGKCDTIRIGVAVPMEFAEDNTNFIKGIELAEEEINLEGIDGKKLQLEIVDDEANFKKAVDVAQAFSRDTKMVAVIGHWFSEIAIPISTIYEDAGMLTVVPTVSNPDLTSKKQNYVFQSITSDKKIARAMCQDAREKEYKNVVIYYEESSYGANLAKAIEQEADINGLKVIDRSAGLVTEEQYQKAHDKWNALEYEAVLLALNPEEGITFINTVKNLNKNVGIISADGLDVANLIEPLGQNAEGVTVTTTYSPESQRPELEKFKEKYRAKYNEEADLWASQGYESLMLIIHAISETSSCSPSVLADYLREMKAWKTVSGNLYFNKDGEIEGRKIYKKTVIDGQYQYKD